MTRTDFESLRALFDLAIELEEGARVPALREAGASQPEIERILEMLRIPEPETAHLRHEARQAIEALPAESTRPTIQRYALGRVLGEGGFGIVYEATQRTPVRRNVALKVIRPGLDSRTVLARFDAERQALALMHHPCVAQVYDGGMTDDGRPFFAMELVRGQSITSFCDANQLGINARVRLFARVCDAVQHAHSKAVIHRDLKPSNILVEMVDGEAIPKIIDFGVMKAMDRQLTEATLLTEHGMIIGTPEYMSPEQARSGSSAVETRSDLYSLGVILYELLTGVRPFAQGTAQTPDLLALHRAILDQEPRRPSSRLSEIAAEDPARASAIVNDRATIVRSLATVLRRDLDWIVIRCLEKSPERRYPSADALREDLERYLNGAPVAAGPPSNVYRLSKFVRRNRSLVLGAAAVAISFGVATILILLFGLQTMRARTEIELLNAEIESLLSITERSTTIDPYSFGENLKLSLEERFPGSLAEYNATEAAITAIESEMVDKTAASIDSLSGASPTIRARMRVVVAKNYLTLGSVNKGLEQAEKAIEELGPAEARTSPIGMEAEFIALGARQRRSEANLRPNVEDLFERLKTIAGPSDPVTLGTAKLLGVVSSSDAYRTPTLWKQAEAAYQYAADGWTASEGAEHREALSARANLAVALRDQKKYTEAEMILGSVIPTARAVLGVENDVTLHALAVYAELLRRTERASQALPLTTEIVEVGPVVHGEQHYLTSLYRIMHGRVLNDLGRYPEANRTLILAHDGILRIRPRHSWRGTAIDALVACHTAWHATEPGTGHDEAVRFWENARTDPPTDDTRRPFSDH